MGHFLSSLALSGALLSEERREAGQIDNQVHTSMRTWESVKLHLMLGMLPWSVPGGRTMSGL